MERVCEAVRETKGRFLSGVMILSLSTVIVKAIGVFFKIPLLNLIGIEGMGYFNAAYHFFGLLMTLSSAGLPLALSISVSSDLSCGDITRVEEDFRIARLSFGTLSALLSILLFAFSGNISRLLGIPKAKDAIILVSPAVLLSTFTGSVRGYFQGHQMMSPTAISEIIEATGKLCFGLGLATIALKLGKPPEEVAAYAIFGITLGVFASALFLSIYRMLFLRKNGFKRKSANGRDKSRIFSEILTASLPITLGSALLSLTSLLDTLIIPHSLMDSGLSPENALIHYSTYTNLAVPMYSLPISLLLPLSSALVPAVVKQSMRLDRAGEESIIKGALRLTGLIALPSAFGLASLSLPILKTVYGEGQNATELAAPLLTLLSASVFFSGLMTVTNGMLHAYGERGKTILSLAIGASAKIISERLLVSVPKIGIYGAPVSTFLCLGSVVLLNFAFLSETLGYRIRPLGLFLPSLFCSFLAGGCALISYTALLRFMPLRLATLLSIALTAVLYIVFVLKSGALPTEELLRFRRGERLCGLLKKIGFVK